MKTTNLTKATITGALLALAATSGFAHTTCITERTHYTAGYDYTPPANVVVQPAPAVRYAPVTLVAPAVPHFRTFQPFQSNIVWL